MSKGVAGGDKPTENHLPFSSMMILVSFGSLFWLCINFTTTTLHNRQLHHAARCRVKQQIDKISD